MALEICKIKKEKKIPEVPKKVEKKSKQKTVAQNENLRIPKSNEIKPEIKKVKKHNTEKREYKIKDYVVYPKHGVGQILEFKKITKHISTSVKKQYEERPYPRWVNL